MSPETKSFLVIYTENGKFLVRPIRDSVFSLYLDSVFSYPQPCTINLYKNCIPKEATELKVNGRIRKISLNLSFFISDTIQSIEVDSNRIKVVNPGFLQQQYDALNREMMDRIQAFDLRIGNRLRSLYKQSSSLKEKDSIRNVSDILFRTNVARLNLDSTLMVGIKENLSNPISLYAMETYIRTARVLHMNIPKHLFLDQLGSMQHIWKRTKIWFRLKKTVMAMTPLKNLIGNPAPEFIDLKDTSGKLVQLKDFRGKIVFLDFWASWCLPCKEQLRMLKDIYNAQKGRDLEFIGISLDNSFSAWTNEIERSKIGWINISDLKFDKGLTSITYNVTTIPHNFLIDESGIIIGENIPIDQLGMKISELLKMEGGKR